jgi:hypothetical protein
MKYKDNRLFQFLNVVLKKENIDLKEYNPPVFLINRWISMANPIFSKIVNLTINKWNTKKDTVDIKSFYKTILPKHQNQISYIKKKEKEKDQDGDLYLANLMECSQRELLLFKETLEELKCVAK